MLRTRSGLPRLAAKWASQVAASVGATMVASLIYTALPKSQLPESPAPRPELTSGGKFAVRAILPVADDGLDAMPAPHVTPMPVRLAPLASAADGATPPVAERRIQKPAHAALRADARHGAVAAEPMPRLASAAVVTAVEPVAASRPESGRDDGGFMPALLPSSLPSVLPKVVSTARAAWTLTASAGESLVARVVPQIP